MSLVFEHDFSPLKVTVMRKEKEVTKTITGATQKAVMLALADHANDEGEGAYPSLTRLEIKTGLGRGKVSVTLRALKDAGYLTAVGRSRRQTTNYTLTVSALKPSPRWFTCETSTGLPVKPEVVYLLNPKHPIRTKSMRATSARAELAQLETLFSEVSGIPKPTPNTPKEKKSAATLWYQPLRRIQAAANGSSPDIIRQSIHRLRKNGLTISAPLSIEKTALAIVGEQNTNQSYTTPEL